MTKNTSFKKPIICDGAFGTYFSSLYPNFEYDIEEANIYFPEAVINIHKEYISSGAKWIRTNSFQIPKSQNNKEKLYTWIKKAYELAKKASAECDNISIIANIGPITDEYWLNFDDQDICKENILIEEVKSFYNVGASIFNFESFGNLDEILPSLEWIYKNTENCTVLTNFSINDSGYTFEGKSIGAIFQKVDELPMIDYVGLSCGLSSGQMRQALENLQYWPKKPLCVFPNGGHISRSLVGNHKKHHLNFYKEQMEMMSNLGAQILGGCCLTTPDYIKTLSSIEYNGEITRRNAISVTPKKTQNHFMEKLNTNQKVIAVELDPPFNQELSKLVETANKMKTLPIDMITLADSPMARSRMDSLLAGLKIKLETGFDVMPHICCRDKNSLAVRGMFLGAHANDIQNFLIITGDPVQGHQKESIKKVFNFNSISMMKFIEEMNEDLNLETPLIYGGAINQSRPNFEVEMKRVKEKIEAGAKYFLTQPIFSKEDMRRLKIIKETFNCHILCGIMPLISYKNAYFIKNEIHGIEVPDEILSLYHPEMTKEEGEWVGVNLAKSLMLELKDLASGFYFMLPFNRVSILEKLFGEKQ